MSKKSSDNILEREKLWTPEYILENAVFEDELDHLEKKDMRVVLSAHRETQGNIIIHDSLEGEYT